MLVRAARGGTNADTPVREFENQFAQGGAVMLIDPANPLGLKIAYNPIIYSPRVWLPGAAGGGERGAPYGRSGEMPCPCWFCVALVSFVLLSASQPF